ncbi:MAG: hypothetical protein HBSAPP03_21000 [Phycisphaerae bacterium]|nr:MAG: hypothetical protein HBSAPP03_21000 [Phycisphaerae bacterium]
MNTKSLVALAAVMSGAAAASAQPYLDWSWQFSSSGYTYTNTSSAGTITGFSAHPAFAAAPGTWGMPFAITTQAPLTTALQIHGTNGLGNDVTFNFSNNYGWGPSGRMLIGNIHNCYEYTVSAWDFNNNPINTNTWNFLGEYPSTSAGTIGYFSTSTTNITAAGMSTRFWVNDTSASANLGQGGVLHMDGLTGIGRIELRLTNSALSPNAQQVDLLFFNIAPTPAPGAGALAACGLVMLARRRRRGAGGGAPR